MENRVGKLDFIAGEISWENTQFSGISTANTGIILMRIVPFGVFGVSTGQE